MAEKKTVDDLLKSYSEKEHELSELGSSIQGSAQTVAVVFIDLADSTEIKQRLSAERWLRHVFNFIRRVTYTALLSKGTVVKRIGDELLITFDEAGDAESFISNVTQTDLFEEYRFKLAADFGEVYHFQFEQSLEKDPYGNVVDRCARLAKLAAPGAVLASRSYAAEVKDITEYLSLGQFKLKGFAEPQGVFLRPLDSDAVPEDYHGPLLKDLKHGLRTGYRYVSRKFTPSYFRENKSFFARPFLLRELLNVPKLPFTAAELYKHLRTLKRAGDALDYYGTLVEWEIVYGQFNNFSDEEVMGYCYDEETDWHVSLQLPAAMLDVMNLFKRGDKIRVRGIIHKIDGIGITLNYVDVALPEENPAPSPAP